MAQTLFAQIIMAHVIMAQVIMVQVIRPQMESRQKLTCINVIPNRCIIGTHIGSLYMLNGDRSTPIMEQVPRPLK